MTQLSPLVEFGEWMPDMPDHNNLGATVAKNVLPNGKFYKPMQALAESATDALLAGALGGITVQDINGDVHTFAGTATKLYKLDGTSWDDVTRTSGGDYTTGSDGFWRFVQFDQYVIATNMNDEIQSFLLNSSTNFAALTSTSGVAPLKCLDLEVVDNFLVCIHTNDATDGLIPYRIRWSALGDPTNFAVSATTLSDYQDIRQGGRCQGIAKVANGAVIISERAVNRMDFVGAPVGFSFNDMEEERGTRITTSVVSDGANAYYIGESGVFMFNGSKSVPIGKFKVDEWLNSNLDNDFFYKVSAGVDPINNLVAWAFPTSDATDGTPNIILFYNPVVNRFTYVEQEIEVFFPVLSFGYSLEDLDAIYTSLEDIPFSLDSRVWAGGKSLFGAFTTTHKIGYFNGSIMDAKLVTQESRLFSQGRALVTSILPITDATGVTIKVKYRDLQSDTVSETGAVSANDQTGECNVFVDSRYFRAEVDFTGDWADAQGVKFRGEPAGVI